MIPKQLPRQLKVLHVVGARPNFMKIAPIMREMANYPEHFEQQLLHTGQHYDTEMSQCFFDDLKLPKPDIYLGIGSGSHAEQTAKIMIAFEKVCIKENPNVVIVVGDVNSTIACALVAAKLGISIAHVEAGLRSFDRSMPEEINRILTDHLSDFLFTTSEDAGLNLKREGIDENKIFFVGNVMIDSLRRHLKIAQESEVLEKLGLRDHKGIVEYGLLTLHRPSNVDFPIVLKGILDVMNELSHFIPIIFPIHPRTLKQLRDSGYLGNLNSPESIDSENPVDKLAERIHIIPSLGYLDFLCLMSKARLVFTDSGGIQEETTILGIPCLTIRNNTERPVTITMGTNILVGTNPDKIRNIAMEMLNAKNFAKRKPRLWDGKTANRIVKVFAHHYCLS